MRCIDGENELILTCETQEEGVCILRCETRDPVVLLPDEIDGAPVTALGRYVLSGRAPDLSGRDTFSVRVTCGGPLPVHEADSIRAVTLPKHARTVGSYAFYNCRSLEELTMTDSVSAFDGGSLMNCLSLHRIRLLAPPGGATCLPKILGETLEAILSMFGDRMGKLLLKQAVEQNICNHIIASDTDIDAATYQKMRGMSYQEVLRTNGQISFSEVLRQQNRL